MTISLFINHGPRSTLEKITLSLPFRMPDEIGASAQDGEVLAYFCQPNLYLDVKSLQHRLEAQLQAVDEVGLTDTLSEMGWGSHLVRRVT